MQSTTTQYCGRNKFTQIRHAEDRYHAPRPSLDDLRRIMWYGQETEWRQQASRRWLLRTKTSGCPSRGEFCMTALGTNLEPVARSYCSSMINISVAVNPCHSCIHPMDCWCKALVTTPMIENCHPKRSSQANDDLLRTHASPQSIHSLLYAL